MRNLAVVLFLSVSCLEAQDLTVDSLIQQEQYQDAKAYCESVLVENVEEINTAFYMSRLGDIYYYLGDLRQSLRYYLQAAEDDQMASPLNDNLRQETYSYLGFVYRELGLDQEAEHYINESLQLARQLHDTVEQAIAFYNLGTVMLQQGAIDSAMYMLQQAYEIDVARKDTAAIGFDLTLMGSAMMKTGNPEKAIKHYRESIELLLVSSGNYNSMAKRCSMLAQAYMANAEWDSAQAYVEKALAIYSEGSDSVHIAQQWITLGQLTNLQQRHSVALDYANQALNVLEHYPRGLNTLKANEVRFQAYQGLGKLQSALGVNDQSLELAVQLGLIEQVRDAYLDRSELLERMQNHKEALSAYKMAQQYSDSLAQMERDRVAEAMRVRYDAEKVASENQVLLLENTVAKNRIARRESEMRLLVAIGVVVLLLITGGAWLVVSRSRMKEKLLIAEVNELRARIRGILDFKPEQVGVAKEQINESLEETLSDREFEILNLVLSNKSNGQIAEELFVSINTVKFHLKNIYTKLGVSNRKEALKFVVQVSS
ncbi:tetratricopeptide repeat protein [Marinoscillum furvescens]|nr:tetratricopeptide repeat protein [Marinoscillum furvescens]